MHRSPRAWTIAAIVLFVGLAAVIVRLAWLGDDAYITLRTVENWLAGRGLCWNPGERVQTFTHPLWLLLLAAGRVLTGECYFTTIALSIGLSLLAAWMLARLPGHAIGAAVVLALLLASRSFVEFATSGLETPLSFVLLAALGAVMPRPSGPRRLSLVALLCGLAAWTRMDLGLLFAPALLAAMWRLPLRQSLPRVLLGLAPFLAWEAFATIYYGTPFPVTAYAKAIAVGIPLTALLQQGCWYVVYVASHDPLTLAVIVGGIATGLWRRELRCRALALGALLYCVYVVKVGGDFMAGRFALPPFVLALAVLARAAAAVTWRSAAIVLGFAVALLFVPGPPDWLHAPAQDLPPDVEFHGIIDERRFYYRKQGLLSPDRDPPHANVTSQAIRNLGRERPVYHALGMVGRDAFQAGELVHVVDPWLCDPLLMRLPVADPEHWRIGHFARTMPEGYLETVAFGGNHIHHHGLARFYDALHEVITAPVLDADRLITMWRLWRGDFDGGLRDYIATDYRTPPRLSVAASELPPLPGAGAPQPRLPVWWFDEPRAQLIYWGGIEVHFAAPQTAARLRLRLNGKLVYRLSFCRGSEPVGSVDVDAFGFDQFLGLQTFEVAVPPAAGPFDSIRVDVPRHPSYYVACLGGLELLR